LSLHRFDEFSGGIERAESNFQRAAIMRATFLKDDYCDIDPMFGDLAGFDRLLAAVHGHGLRLLLDLVPNHPSDQHPWIVESRSSRENPKRDWYIWRDPAPSGGPPNNWISDFGGSSWHWDETTGQYYLHAFLKEQPDLNWRKPQVREAMMAVLRFWFDRGVDGFRIDVLWHIVKAEALPALFNAPRAPDGRHPCHERRCRTATEGETLLPMYAEYQDIVQGPSNLPACVQPFAFFSLCNLRFSFGLRCAFFCFSLLPLSLLPLSPISASP
jgi:hypothetical protein